MSKSLKIASNDIDVAIVEYFKTEKRVHISLRDAEILKKEIGNVLLQGLDSYISENSIVLSI